MVDGAGSSRRGRPRGEGAWSGNHLTRAVLWPRSPARVRRLGTAPPDLGRNTMSVPVPSPVTGTQRVAAAVALLSAGLTVLIAVAVAVIRFPSGLGVLLCI